MPPSAEVDTTKLQRAGRKLADALTTKGKDTAQRQAQQTADKVRAGVPVRTGLLASTVSTVADPLGYGVTYGGGLRYAGPMEKRFHAVRDGVQGADAEFRAACQQLAQESARKL